MELGAHTRSHRDLRRASAGELQDELAGCAAHIARETGVRPSSFAYSWSSRRHRGLGGGPHLRAGLQAALKLLGPGEDVYRVPRLDAYYFRAPG